MDCFFGLDLSTREEKLSAFAVLDEKGGVICLGFLGTNVEILNIVDFYHPKAVAIDAPLSLPRGLCCLEEACSCKQEGLKGRECERGLAKLGLGCFYTTKRSIIKGMVIRGIELKKELERCGFEVIEVYPYAIKDRLFGKGTKKTTAAGLTWLRERLGNLFPALVSQLDILTHDQADAILAAYTAFLYYQGKTEAIGESAEGLIHIPVAAPGRTYTPGYHWSG